MAINVLEKMSNKEPSFEVTVYDEPKKHVRGEVWNAFIHFEVDWINTEKPIVRIDERETGMVVKNNKGLDTNRKRDTINALFEAKVIRR